LKQNSTASSDIAQHCSRLFNDITTASMRRFSMHQMAGCLLPVPHKFFGVLGIVGFILDIIAVRGKQLMEYILCGRCFLRCILCVVSNSNYFES
jgi:hypothetical protein